MGRLKWLLPWMAISLASCNAPRTPVPPFDWRTDWAIETGFSIQRDINGLQFPTAIAFVPNPGPDPKDPLYFVTEIAGRVKVVTNDKSVYTFAEGFMHLAREKELPDDSGQIGTAGLCLDPTHGYVFATFLTQDDDAIYRNRIIRFESAPQKFSIRPLGQTLLTAAFQRDRLAPLGHHIDSCFINDGLLYAGVGDGYRTLQSQDPDTLSGKVVRMTLDGLPVRDNPFWVDDDPGKPRNYVWGSGFRNPFGLSIVGGDTFVADNGNDADRFVRLTRGQNYLWDGSDLSIGTNADAVFAPSIAPATMEFLPNANALFPAKYAGQFFLASATYEAGKKPGVLTLAYDFPNHRMKSPPSYFLRYRGEGLQSIAGLAFGPDALYILPLIPDKNGTTAVLRITYDPAHAHPFALTDESDVAGFLFQKGCFGCHSLKGSLGSEGPQLDAHVLVPRLQARLNAEAYRERIRAADSVDEEPMRDYRSARQRILDAKESERVRLWLIDFLQEPRFDNPNSRMPNLGLNQTQAERIADYLMVDDSENALQTAWYRIVPVLQDHLIVLAVFSFLFGGMCFAVGSHIWNGRQRRG